APGGGGNPVGGPGPNVGSEVADLTPPPMPDGFSLTGAISHLIAECAPPLYTQGHGHGETVLYGALATPANPEPVFADAVEVGQFPGTVFAYPADPSTTWRMWIK